MEEQVLKESRKSAWKWVLAVILALVLLSVAAYLVVFHVNRFSLAIRLTGEEKITLEYGESYQDPGAEAIFSGTLFWEDGIAPEDVQLQISSEVDEKTLGRYTVSYTADYHKWHAEAQRTVCIVDTQSPVITLVEDAEETLLPGTVYQEAGFTATDNYDGDITDRVVRTETMGLITYAVIDSAGNPAYAERKIPYHDPLPPEITLEGGENYVITTGTQYTEPGFTATDNVDGDLTAMVMVEGEVDWLEPGFYPITYTVTDAYENAATVTRTVEVAAEPRPETLYPEGTVIDLTFDDGPGPYTETLLDVLDSYGVKATFFVTDSGYDSVMKQIVDRGHSIGIHTVSHDYEEIYASPEAYFDDLFRMQDIIYENTGVKTTLMRFPGGSSNTVSRGTYKGLMTILTEAVQNAGFQYFDWNVDSNDAGGAEKAKTVLSNVKDGVSRTRISVVLQHDIHAFSVDAVEDIIVWGLNNGYSFQSLTPNSPGMHHGVNN